jgi:hypothetical protein
MSRKAKNKMEIKWDLFINPLKIYGYEKNYLDTTKVRCLSTKV